MGGAGRGPLPPIQRLCDPPGAIVRDDGTVIAASTWTAARFPARAVGLLGTPTLGPDEALWVPRCGYVHTWGMGMPIACVLLDRDGIVIRIADPVPAWRIVGTRRARTVIEGPPGFGARVRIGDRLHGPDQSSGPSSR
jgi:hypothetical protein